MFYAPVYDRWLKKVFAEYGLENSLKETAVSCSHCRMVGPFDDDCRPLGPFLPETKCCTFLPYWPNFSIGALLTDIPEVQLNFYHGLSKEAILLPLGMFPSSARKEKLARLGPQAFGKSTELLCPFHCTESGTCDIWSYRPGVCSSYFCTSSFGAGGLEFWKKVETFLNHFEWTLAHEVLWQLGFTQDEIRKMEVVRKQAEISSSDIDQAWAEYASQKESFYKKCYQAACGLAADTKSLLGETGEALMTGIHAKAQVLFTSGESNSAVLGCADKSGAKE